MTVTILTIFLFCLGSYILSLSSPKVDSALAPKPNPVSPKIELNVEFQKVEDNQMEGLVNLPDDPNRVVQLAGYLISLVPEFADPKPKN